MQYSKIPLWMSNSAGGITFIQHLYTYVAAQGLTDEFEVWLGREFESPAQAVIGLNCLCAGVRFWPISAYSDRLSRLDVSAYRHYFGSLLNFSRSRRRSSSKPLDLLLISVHACANTGGFKFASIPSNQLCHTSEIMRPRARSEICSLIR